MPKIILGACEILVPQPGIKPSPPQWKHGVLTTGSTGKSLNQCLKALSMVSGTICAQQIVALGPLSRGPLGFHKDDVLTSTKPLE